MDFWYLLVLALFAIVAIRYERRQEEVDDLFNRIRRDYGRSA